MSQDEAGTLRALAAHREVMDELITDQLSATRAQWPKERPDFFCKCIGLLHGSEMTAAFHHAPPHDVAKSPFGN